MRAKTKYGQQPLYAVLRKQRWTIAALSRELNISQRALYLAARGQNRPNTEQRRLLPQFLETPIESLFTEEALSQPPWHGAGGWGTTRQTKKGR